MSALKSFLLALREAHYNPWTMLHFGLYGATPTYLKVLRALMVLGPPAFRKHVSETYHAKVMTPEHAKKLITINRDVEYRNLEQILPYEHAKDLVLKNPSNIIAFECPCRAQRKNPCSPTDVCLVVGDPFADLFKLSSPRRSRRISVEEALEILDGEHRRGHVHTAWFKTAMLDRFYALCNCCSCCCLGLEGMRRLGVKNVLPSGFVAYTRDDCTGCGRCAKKCQFKAIELRAVKKSGRKKTARILEEKCFGCGVCETVCRNENIALRREPSKGLPLDIEALGEPTKSPTPPSGRRSSRGSAPRRR